MKQGNPVGLNEAEVYWSCISVDSQLTENTPKSVFVDVPSRHETHICITNIHAAVTLSRHIIHTCELLKRIMHSNKFMSCSVCNYCRGIFLFILFLEDVVFLSWCIYVCVKPAGLEDGLKLRPEEFLFSVWMIGEHRVGEGRGGLHEKGNYILFW